MEHSCNSKSNSRANGCCESSSVSNSAVTKFLCAMESSAWKGKPKANLLVLSITHVLDQIAYEIIWYFGGKVCTRLWFYLGQFVWKTTLVSHCPSTMAQFLTWYSGPCFFLRLPVRCEPSRYFLKIGLSFACDSTSAGGGNDVNTNYYAWNSTESISISTPAIVCSILYAYLHASLSTSDNNVPLTMITRSLDFSHPSLLLTRSRPILECVEILRSLGNSNLNARHEEFWLLRNWSERIVYLPLIFDHGVIISSVTCVTALNDACGVALSRLFFFCAVIINWIISSFIKVF
jgi:hypothetical protein